LDHNNRDHPIFNPKEDTPDIFILSQIYKNVPSSFRAYKTKLVEWLKDTHEVGPIDTLVNKKEYFLVTQDHIT
jgi:hypothetical protein